MTGSERESVNGLCPHPIPAFFMQQYSSFCYNAAMRRLLITLSMLLPAGLLIFFSLRPAADPLFAVPIFHFYIVTFATFTALVISFLLGVALKSVAQPRHVLAAIAFGLMSALFLIHALTTPGALIPVTHPAVPAVSWSAWLTLFSGGAVFMLAALSRPQERPQRSLSQIAFVVALVLLVYVAIVLAMPQLLSMIEESAAPWHRWTIFLATLLVWLLTTYGFRRTWQETGDSVDGSLALVAAWMTLAAISLHLFPLWRLSWWLYHFLLLAGFLFTTYMLLRRYERARHFRLSHYYLAVGLVQTVLLALVASFLYTRVTAYLVETGAGMEGALLGARVAGLVIAVAAMGLLLLSLLLVVRRAEGIIASRTEELAAALRDLRQSEALRDDLTSMIIHDLRTPLTSIRMSLGLLKHASDGETDTVQTRVVERSGRAVERLEQMIDDILTVSKIESGEFQLQKEDVALHDWLQERLELFAPQAAAEAAPFPTCLQRVGGMFCTYFTAGPVANFADAAQSDTKAFGKFFRFLLNEGINIAPSQFEAGFMSVEHSTEDLDKTIDAAKRGFQALK